MWPQKVITMHPYRQASCSFPCVVIRFGVCPLIQCCSNEAFCLAVGLWPARPGSLVLYPKFTTVITKLTRAVARSVIRQIRSTLMPCEAYQTTAGHKNSTADSAVSSGRMAVYAALEASSTQTCRHTQPGRLRRAFSKPTLRRPTPSILSNFLMSKCSTCPGFFRR